jgi:hypothetical protein
MNNLLLKYGYCVLKPGTVLYTIKDKPFTLPESEVFFYLESDFDGFSLHGDTTYNYEVTKSILCLCPLFLHASGRCLTYFKEIFEDEMKVPWRFKSNVNMKTDILVRKQFIEYLKQNNIDGWISPEEFSIKKIEALIVRPKECLKLIGEVQNTKRLENRIEPILGSIVNKNAFANNLTKIKQSHKGFTIFDTIAL